MGLKWMLLRRNQPTQVETTFDELEDIARSVFALSPHAAPEDLAERDVRFEPITTAALRTELGISEDDKRSLAELMQAAEVRQGQSDSCPESYIDVVWRA